MDTASTVSRTWIQIPAHPLIDCKAQNLSFIGGKDANNSNANTIGFYLDSMGCSYVKCVTVSLAHKTSPLLSCSESMSDSLREENREGPLLPWVQNILTSILKNQSINQISVELSMHQAWFKELGQIVSTLLCKSLHSNREKKRKENKRKWRKGKEEKFNPCRGTNSQALCQEYFLQICSINQTTYGFSVALTVRNLPEMQETQVPFLGMEDPLEKEMATHSSILAWRIPWTEEPGRLQSMGSQRGRQNLATEHSTLNQTT